MAINFPDSPALNDTFTSSGKTWKWNGTLWKLEASSGPGVTEYATINDLITASKGSLAEGYYEVTTVPSYHPQYPRIITYWDGAAFEPQISTGFESRPTLVDERFVWDAKEQAFRNKTWTAGQDVYQALDLSGVGTAAFCGVSTGLNTSVSANGWLARNTGSGQRWFGSGGVTSTSKATLIFAGLVAGPGIGTANTVLQIGGSNSARRAFACLTRQASVFTWHLGDRSEYYDTTVAPRTTDGDVVIATVDGTAWAIWINGAKYTFTASATVNIINAALHIDNSFNGGDHPRGEYAFIACTGSVIDGADVKTWTTWLQDRYSIPAL